MNPTNSGSFGAAAGGGGSAIASAMQSRGMDPGILNQVTAGAPTAPDRLPPGNVSSGSPSALPPQGSPGGLPPKTAESEIIVKALNDRLKKLGELQSAGIQI